MSGAAHLSLHPMCSGDTPMDSGLCDLGVFTRTDILEDQVRSTCS